MYLVGRDITDRKRAEEKFRGLLESAPDAMVITDRRGQIILTNRQSEELFGYCRDELLGEPVEKLIPNHLRGRHEQHLSEYSRQPHARAMGEETDLYGLHKDGTEIPVEISLSPLETEEGLLIIAAVRDVSRRRKAERAFRQLLESAPDAMIVVDEGGKIALVNAQTERFFQYSREELVGNPLEMLMPDRFRDGHFAHLRKFFQDPQLRPMGIGIRLSGLRKDGTEFPVEISLSPVETESGLLVASAVRDASSRGEDGN